MEAKRVPPPPPAMLHIGTPEGPSHVSRKTLPAGHPSPRPEPGATHGQVFSLDRLVVAISAPQTIFIVFFLNYNSIFIKYQINEVAYIGQRDNTFQRKAVTLRPPPPHL